VTQDKTTKTLKAIALIATGSLLSLVLALVLFGGAAPIPYSDPGGLVRWGTPFVKILMNLSMAITVGSLVLSAFAGNEAERERLRPVAAWAASLWLLSASIYFVFTYLSASGSQISYGPEFSESLWLFATQIELGMLLGWNLMFAFILSLSVIAFRDRRMVAVNAAIAIAGLYPLAESGHASADAGHAIAVNSMLMHLVGISVWVGGLFALYAVFSGEKGRAQILASRYSTLALFAFILVAVSGVTAGYIRLYQPSDLLSGYGLLLIGKAVVLVLLGVYGAIHRRNLIAKISDGAVGFWKLAASELLFMGVAMGLATALARTAPPVSPNEFVPPTAAELLAGDPLPPELLPSSWFTVWDFDVLWATISILGILVYLYGVSVLRKRGDKWPVIRTASWIFGMVTLFYVTNGAPNAYQEYLFSVHMVGHMILTMMVPVLLVPGAPVTLLSRAQAPRTDGSFGLREWVLWAVHTPYSWFLSQPLFAGLNFALSLVMFYYTPLFRFSTESHLGHQWMIGHFLLTGYLFAQSLIGIDPQPHKPVFPVKLMLLIGTMAFHAFFGLGLMNEKGLLLADWFGSMGRTWGDDPLADQAIGGAFAWGVGELPTLAITLIVVYQWSKSDDRERKRLDRASDRSGNKDILDYNQMLEKLNQTPERRN
jgi:cytochrome c oxidase assembly factor CtaG/putative copper export protein